MTTPQPPAGWYRDPTGRPGDLYWDGRAERPGLTFGCPKAT